LGFFVYGIVRFNQFLTIQYHGSITQVDTMGQYH